jgi:hypothetical protein
MKRSFYVSGAVQSSPTVMGTGFVQQGGTLLVSAMEKRRGCFFLDLPSNKTLGPCVIAEDLCTADKLACQLVGSAYVLRYNTMFRPTSGFYCKRRTENVGTVSQTQGRDVRESAVSK